MRTENKLDAPTTHLVTSDRMTKMGGVYVYHRKGRRANRGEIGPDIRMTGGKEAILGKTSIITPLLVGMLPILQPRKYYLLLLSCVSGVHNKSHVGGVSLAFPRDARIQFAYYRS